MKTFAPLLFAAVVPGFAFAQDWPRYLGPDGAGRVDGEIRTDWKAEKPVELWRK
jgi:hypothetical protein